MLVNQESLREDCHLSRSLKEVGEPTVGSSGAMSGAGRGNSRCRMPEAGVCTARHSGGQCVANRGPAGREVGNGGVWGWEEVQIQ